MKLFSKIPWLKNRSHDFRRGLVNASFNSGGAILVPLAWLISAPYFVQKLGMHQFGIWMLINTVLGFSQLMAFGLTDAVIKHVAKYRALGLSEKVSRVIQTCMFVYAILGLLAGCLVFLLAPVLSRCVFNIRPENMAIAVGAFRIAAFGIVARLFQEFLASILRGFERYDVDVSIHTIASICIILVNVALLSWGYGLRTVVLSAAILIAIQGIVQIVFLKCWIFRELRLLPVLYMIELRETFAYGIFVFVQTFFGRINLALDQFLIAAYLNTSAVSYYAVSRKLMQNIYAVLGRSSSFLFPFSAKLFEQKDWHRLYRWYVKSSLVVVVIAISIILPVFFLGESLLCLWMGKTFAAKAQLVLKILCIRYVVMPLGIVANNYLRGAGMVRFQTLITFLAAPLITCGLLVLVPEHGIAGAAVAALFSLPFVFITRIYLARKLFQGLSGFLEVLYLAPVLLAFLAVGLLQGQVVGNAQSWAELAVKFAVLSATAFVVGGGTSWLVGTLQLKLYRWEA